jgi:tetratricopeptide (TPR) repeat protein
VLELSFQDEERVAYFHDGNIAFLEARPFREETALGHLLTHHRRLTESALRDGLTKARAARKPLGRALVALGLARSSDVVSALREQTRSRLESTFSWPRGAFEVRAWREPPGHADLVVTRGLGIVAHHLRRRFAELGLSDLEALLGDRLRAGARPSPRLERAASALGLPPKELRFLQVSLEGRGLEEAARLSSLGKLAALRLAALAFSLGLLDTERGPASSSSGRRRGPSGDRASRMRRELRARLELLERQNHFEVLGVHWSSHHRSYRAAYEAILAELSTVRGPYQNAPADVQMLARKCSQRVKLAFDVLSDDAKRVAYRKELFDATEREYSAQMLVEKGEVALMRGDRVGAIEHLETAVELAPSERNRKLLRAAREGRP